MPAKKRFGRSYVVVAWLAVVMAVGAPSSTQAALITVDFQGTVDAVDSGLGSVFSAGQILTGSYTFDSGASNVGGPIQAVYDAVTSLSFSVSGPPGYSAASAAAQQIQIDINEPTLNLTDRYSVVAVPPGLVGDPVGGNALSLFTIVLLDSSNTVFSDVSLPTSISLSSFDTRAFFIDFGNLASPLVVSGTIDSLAVIPEPTTLIIWTLLGGLAISIGWWRRKRAA